MSAPLLLLLLAPIVGAVIAISFAEVPTQRRVLVLAASAAMLGGAAAALVRTAAAEQVAWRGFAGDAWTALLTVGAVSVIVAGIARAGARTQPGPVEASLFLAAAAGVAPLLVRNVHLLAVTLPAGTLAFSCAAFAANGRGRLGVAEFRVIAFLALSDVAALVALGTAVSKGTALPPALSIPAAGALLASAAIRLGMVPLGLGAADGRRADPVLSAIWLGPIRAQGLLLLPVAVAADRGIAYAAAAAAAATALVASGRALRDPGLGPATAAGVAFASLGLALGGSLAIWGATLCVAATFAAIPVWYATGGLREGSRPTLGVLPAGALLPGATLVLAGLFDAAAVRPAFTAFALPALVAALLLATAVASAFARSAVHPRDRGDAIAAKVWGWLALAAVVAMVAVPVRATHGLAFPVADALGVGRLLGTPGDSGIGEDLALAMVIAGFLALLIGPGRAGSGGPPGRSSRAPFAGNFALLLRLPDRLRIDARGWSFAAGVLFAASIGVAIRVYVVAAGRGFL